MKSITQKDPILNNLNNFLVKLPVPINMNVFWNFGSLLGISLVIQILSGLFLAMQYTSEVNNAFFSVNLILRDVNFGWLLRIIHSNGASMFFFCLYLHIGRNIYYSTFTNLKTWFSGIILLIMIMATAFLGYVLPWGQMSFWGATVITNLFSSIPFLGKELVYWLWGGFSVDAPTLNRFFALHFLMPFLILFMVIIHLTFLHEKGSSNPLGISSNNYFIKFHSYYTIKDFLGILIYLFFFLILISYYPWIFGDPENFLPANALITPQHIQPEWYFLFAYAILRSIPNKSGGVMALFFSILILFILPFLTNFKIKSTYFNLFKKLFFWNLVMTFFLLTWIGARPASGVYIILGQSLTLNYFFYFFFLNFLSKFNENLLKF